MLKSLQKLKYGARVLLARSGQLEMVEVAGRATQVRHGGQGPPFVYLHSALGECVWLPFLETWSKQFAVYAPAHPGFAKSEGVETIHDIEDYCFHTLDLLDTLGLDRVCLGGVSLGGLIAVEFAVRWPERVHRLWLADAPGLWLDDEPLIDLFRIGQNVPKLREAMFHDPEGYQATMLIKDLKDRDEPTMVAAYQNMAALARVVWERPYDPKLAGRLRRITCPTLILWGESDRLIPPAYGREYHRLIPGSQIEIIPDCGHFPMFEQEKAFVERVARFCADGRDA